MHCRFCHGEIFLTKQQWWALSLTWQANLPSIKKAGPFLVEDSERHQNKRELIIAHIYDIVPIDGVKDMAVED